MMTVPPTIRFMLSLLFYRVSYIALIYVCYFFFKCLKKLKFSSLLKALGTITYSECHNSRKMMTVPPTIRFMLSLLFYRVSYIALIYVCYFFFKCLKKLKFSSLLKALGTITYSECRNSRKISSLNYKKAALDNYHKYLVPLLSLNLFTRIIHTKFSSEKKDKGG